MKKVLLIVIALAFLVSLGAAACHPPVTYCPKTVQERVIWSVKPWLSLSIEHRLTDLGDLSCRDSASFPNRNRLWVDGNVAWSVTASVGGSSIGGHCPNYFLSVALSPSHGSASSILCERKAEVDISYDLHHLSCLPAGNYAAVITYTVAAQ